MTGHEFATSHGDPATWSPADIEAQQNLAAIDQLPEPVKAWMSMADSLQADADRIRAARTTQPAA